MKKNKDEYDWECAYNHLPAWVKRLEDALDACATTEEKDKILHLLERYNVLTEKEEDPNNSPNDIYGVEDEKEEIINTIVGIYSKYKEEAEELVHLFKQ